MKALERGEPIEDMEEKQRIAEAEAKEKEKAPRDIKRPAFSSLCLKIV